MIPPLFLSDADVNYLSFFSGALGLDLGLERAGFKPLMYCEFDKKCQETITLNQPNVPLLGDIRNYSAQDILQEIGLSQEDTIDLVVGTHHAKPFQQLELDVHLRMNEVTYLFIIFK
jgi:DNA (cytosine-5)-methyltransferase 1